MGTDTKPCREKIQKYQSLSHHWGTKAPTPIQIRKAAEFFQRTPAKFLWSTDKFRLMPFGEAHLGCPEVCFLGRSNVGKSSLLNALLCQPLAYTSSKPGRTKIMSAFAVGSKITQPKEAMENDVRIKSNGLIIFDVPGYGKGGKAQVGQEVIKYLEKRQELKRSFLLIDSEHGLKKTDTQMIELCQQIGAPFQIILSKVDKLISLPTNGNPTSDRLAELIDQVKQVIRIKTNENDSAIGEIIPCSSMKWMAGRRIGINEVRFAVLKAVGLNYKGTRPRFNPHDIITYDQLFPSGV